MDVTIKASLIGAAAVVVSAAFAWLGSRRIPKAQRENLMVDTAQKVVAMQAQERAKLLERLTELETEVRTLKQRYAEREHELELSRGENAKLSAEVGTLRATLAAKEAELAATKALLAAATPPVVVPAGGES